MILIRGVSKPEYWHWTTLRNFGQISKTDENFMLRLGLKLDVPRPQNSINSKLWRIDLDSGSAIPSHLKGEWTKINFFLAEKRERNWKDFLKASALVLLNGAPSLQNVL